MNRRETLQFTGRSALGVIRHFLPGKSGGLLAVRWNLTRHCPLACVYCGAARKPQEHPELKPTEAMALLEALGRAGVAEVSFSGGEPLTRPDLPALAHRAWELGIRPSVNTSGILLASHLDRVQPMALVKVSLDGTETVHDALRGKGMYQKTLCGLQAAAAAGVPLKLVATLSRENCTIQDVAHLLDLARSLRIRALFQLYHPHGDENGNVSFLPEDKQRKSVADFLGERLLHRDSAVDNDYFSLRFLRQDEPVAPFACAAGKLFAVVEADGSILACDRVGHSAIARFDGRDFQWEARMQRDSLACHGCAFQGSLRLNLLASGWRGAYFAAVTTARELFAASFHG